MTGFIGRVISEAEGQAEVAVRLFGRDHLIEVSVQSLEKVELVGEDPDDVRRATLRRTFDPTSLLDDPTTILND